MSQESRPSQRRNFPNCAQQAPKTPIVAGAYCSRYKTAASAAAPALAGDRGLPWCRAIFSGWCRYPVRVVRRCHATDLSSARCQGGYQGFVDIENYFGHVEVEKKQGARSSSPWLIGTCVALWSRASSSITTTEAAAYFEPITIDKPTKAPAVG